MIVNRSATQATAALRDSSLSRSTFLDVPCV